MIIDFHTHTFPDKIAAGTIEKLASASHTVPFSDGSLSGLKHSMETASVDYSVTLPVITHPGQTEKINSRLVEGMENGADPSIIPFGGMHPDNEDPRGVLTFLKEHGVSGIKLHPAYQNTDLTDPKMMRILDIASELDLIVLIHAGIDIGIPEHDYADVNMILRVMKEVAPTKLVLAHMGGWAVWDHVESDLAGAPLWLDTAFSVGPITIDEKQSGRPIISTNLSDEDFIRLSRKHGIDRILFATDSPWEGQAEYIRRIRSMPLTAAEQQQIFSENALSLLNRTE